jgi:hypothetical protein
VLSRLTLMGAGGQKGAVLRNAAPPEPMVLPPVASSNDLDADPEVFHCCEAVVL